MTLPESFWGNVRLRVGEAALGRIGGHGLYLKRELREWHVASGPLSDPSASSGWSLLEVQDSPFGDSGLSRTAFEASPEQVRVNPWLPDRSLVVRPLTEIGVPPGQKVDVFVSAPLWIDVSAGAPLSSIYHQPLDRPPDTWFGESTRSGELCYAGRTSARMNLDNVPLPPERALTRISIDNGSSSQISFSKIKLPLPQLSLYRAKGGRFWTEPAVLVSTEGSLARLEIENDPKWLEGKELIQSPREQADDGLLHRTLGLFLGGSESRFDD